MKLLHHFERIEWGDVWDENLVYGSVGDMKDDLYVNFSTITPTKRQIMSMGARLDCPKLNRTGLERN